MKALNLAMALIVSAGVASLAGAQSVQPASALQSQSALSKKVQALVANAPSVVIEAKITHIDRTTRIVTLRGPKGNVMDLAMGKQVDNFDTLQVGDLVEVLYKNALLVSAEKVAGNNGIRERVDSSVYQSTSSGYSAAREIEVHATVLAINAKKRELKLRGAYDTVTLGVGPDIDLAALKVGDMVQAVFVSAYATKVTPVKPAH
jgi:hypothetical protein